MPTRLYKVNWYVWQATEVVIQNTLPSQAPFSTEEMVPNTQPSLTHTARPPRGIYTDALGSAGEGASYELPSYLNVLPLCTLGTLRRVCVCVSVSGVRVAICVFACRLVERGIDQYRYREMMDECCVRACVCVCLCV